MIGMPTSAYLKAPVFSTVGRIINTKEELCGNQQDGVEAIDFFARKLIHAQYKVVPLQELSHIYDLMSTLFSILKTLRFTATYKLRSS